MAGGNPGRDAEGQEVSVGELAKGKRGRPRKPPTVTCDCDVLVQMVQKPRKARRRPSMIASRGAMKTLDPRPAVPRHVNVARRDPRDY
ncbi:hypothetical protein Bca4012_051293 [Brassica carinata]